ncbi:hypothetical protein D3C84_1077050 [compost metagenome]
MLFSTSLKPSRVVVVSGLLVLPAVLQPVPRVDWVMYTAGNWSALMCSGSICTSYRPILFSLASRPKP